jgi:2-succinyl-5-enolpyruvyl-6-hydroxy-3-cyclohexene-1-carboxylate synthase
MVYSKKAITKNKLNKKKMKNIDLKTATYNVLRKYANELGLQLGRNPLKPVMIKAIEEVLNAKVKALKPKASKVAVNKEVKAETTKKVNTINEEVSATLRVRVNSLELLLVEYVTANKEQKKAIKEDIQAEIIEMKTIAVDIEKGLVIADKTLAVFNSMDTILTVEAEEVIEKTSWLDGIITSNTTTANTPSWMDEFLNSTSEPQEEENDDENDDEE